MEEKIKTNSIIYKYSGLISFVISAFTMLLAFWSQGIYPGGKSMVITYDLRAQLLALYGYLSGGGPGYDNLFHSMSGGLGGGFWGTAVLYLSPFDLIYSFVPVKSLPTAIWLMIIIKVGACGLCCSIFLKRNGKYILPAHLIVLLSCCYALMSYNIMYFMSPMWYDQVMLLPLLALCLEKVIAGKKSPSFVLLMAFCIISDYYIAYMCVISLVLYFAFRLTEEAYSVKECIKRFASFALHGILSAGTSMFIILPVYLDFARGKFSEGDAGDGGVFIKNSIFDVLKSFKSQSYSGLDFNASPNIFCGSVVLIFVLIWLLYTKKNIRSRIAGLLIIAFYFASFIIGPLDRAWHGFRDPVCFSVRYAFTFCFFMICFAIRGIRVLCERKTKLSEANKGLATCIICLFTLIELYINCSFIIAKVGTESGYTYSAEYYKLCDVIEKLTPYDRLADSTTYGRLVTTIKCSSYDGALFGYDGLSRFTSSYNYNLHEFFRKMGIGSLYHSLSEKGITPPFAGLIDAKYYIYYWVDQSDFYDAVKEYRGYTLYENPLALSFAYEINDLDNELLDKFVEDPYCNQNLVYSELFKNDNNSDRDIFEQVSYNAVESDLEPVDPDNILKSIEFTADKTGHYFLFVSYEPEEELYIQPSEDSYNNLKHVYRNYYMDGVLRGEYGNKQYSFCVDLGLLNENETHVLTLESSAAHIGDIWLYYYDSEVYKDYVASVNGFDIKKIDKKGIVLQGTVTADSKILITLPYESGYSIQIDGKDSEYDSYRDSFIVIPVEPGDHEVDIRYCPPGFKGGVIISIISLLVFFCLFLLKKDVLIVNGEIS